MSLSARDKEIHEMSRKLQIVEWCCVSSPSSMRAAEQAPQVRCYCIKTLARPAEVDAELHCLWSGFSTTVEPR